MKFIFFNYKNKFNNIINIKTTINALLFLITLFLLLYFSSNSMQSVKNSVSIFLNGLLPSLLPFMILSELALRSNIFDNISKLFGDIFSKIFKVDKSASIAIILGFLCGFPTGGKAVNFLYENGKISKAQAYTLLSFVNNNNPAFILTTIGVGIFKSISIGFLLLISHYLSAIIIGIIYSRYYLYTIIHENKLNSNRIDKKYDKIVHFNRSSNTYDNLVEILRKSITSAFVNLSVIFGFIIIFNLLFDILNIFLNNIAIPTDIITILSGLIEVTRGSYNILSLNCNLEQIICIQSFLLGFSGICILFQILATISKHNFSLIKVFTFKLTHGILSFIITYILLNYTNLLDINSITISNLMYTNTEQVNYREMITTAYIHSLALILFILSIYMIIAELRKTKNRKYKFMNYNKNKKKEIKDSSKI